MIVKEWRARILRLDRFLRFCGLIESLKSDKNQSISIYYRFFHKRLHWSIWFLSRTFCWRSSGFWFERMIVLQKEEKFWYLIIQNFFLQMNFCTLSKIQKIKLFHEAFQATTFKVFNYSKCLLCQLEIC